MDAGLDSRGGHSMPWARFGLIVAQCYVIGTAVALAAVYYIIDSSPEAWIYPACVAHVLVVAWMLWTWKRHAGTMFDPYGLFLMAAALFNGGLILLEALHLNKPGLAAGRLPAEVVLQTIFFVTVGLASLHLGALIGLTAGSRTPRPVDPVSQEMTRQNTKVVGWVLLSIALIPTLFELRSAVATVMSHGYFGLYQRSFSFGIGSAARVLATFLFPAVCFLAAGSRRSDAGAWVAGFVLLSWAACYTVLGYRGQTTLSLIAFAWLWDRAVRPLPKKTCIAIALPIVLIGFPLLAAVRTIAGEDRLSFALVVGVLQTIENPAVAVVKEFGSTFWTVAHTIHFVPAVRPFDLGASYGLASLSLFPNLFWDVHPSLGQSPSAWLIGLIAPRTAAAGGGVGYSFIAEAFLNFGWVGGALLLVVMGLGLGRLVASVRGRPDAARLALTASAMVFVLFYVRADMATIIRGVMWYALVPYAVVRLVGGLRGTTPSAIKERREAAELTSIRPPSAWT